mmetsp:Transcript_22521/g.37645  ORF Transcript_22521/g.37645 Transcript_22521/m.37645 type:complete len:126 (+) Transcript_22521:227-604(+)
MVKASGSETITVRSDVRAGAAEALDMDGFEQLEEGDANGEDGGDVDLGNPLELRFDVHVSKEHCENEMTFECVFRHDEFEIVDLAVGPQFILILIRPPQSSTCLLPGRQRGDYSWDGTPQPCEAS